MGRNITDDPDPNPELGSMERAVVMILLCIMVGWLGRQLLAHVAGVRRMRRLQREVDEAAASYQESHEDEDHSD